MFMGLGVRVQPLLQFSRAEVAVQSRQLKICNCFCAFPVQLSYKYYSSRLLNHVIILRDITYPELYSKFEGACVVGFCFPDFELLVLVLQVEPNPSKPPKP